MSRKRSRGWQGRSRGKRPSDFDREQLRVGTEVELEHTPDRRIARRIAMDHLTESPDYYRELSKMEQQLMIANTTATKKRGAIVEGDWYLVEGGDFDGEVEPVDPFLFERFGPDPERTHIHALALRIPDGRWKLEKSRAQAKRDYQRMIRTASSRYDWAERIEALVRQKLKAHRGRAIKASAIDRGVTSSYLYPGRTREWVRPDPFYVYIFTENGIGDPFQYPDVYAMMEQATEDLSADRSIEDAYWDSVNPAVHYVAVEPKMSG